MIRKISSLKECYISTNKAFSRHKIKAFVFFLSFIIFQKYTFDESKIKLVFYLEKNYDQRKHIQILLQGEKIGGDQEIT